MSTHTYAPSDFEPVFKLVNSLVSSGRLPTGVLGITDSEGTIDLRGYGAWPDGRPVRTDDVYLLYSVTKPFIGLAIMQLWEQGKLNLNHELKRYLPGFGSARPDTVTLWHLLTHTSGIDQSSVIWPPVNRTPEEMRAMLINAGMQFTAGTHKLYCNFGLLCLAEVIHEVSGQEKERYLQEHVFGPLGMHNSSFDTFLKTPERVIPTQQPGALDVEGYMRARLASGGMQSTAPDLLLLGQALLNGGTLGKARIISPLTLKAMTTPQTIGIPALKPIDFVGTEVGLTWMMPHGGQSIIAGVAQDGIYGHDGWGGCMLWVYPRQGVCFVFMTNLLDPALKGTDLNVLHNAFAACL